MKSKTESSVEPIRQDKLLTEYLVSRNLIREVELRASIAEQKVTEESLGSILVRNGFIRHEDYIEGLLSITNDSLMDEEIILPHLPPEVLINTKTKVIAETVNSVYLATLLPKLEVEDTLKEYFPSQNIVWTSANPSGIENYLYKLETISDSEISLMESIFRNAITARVSDIHIVPKNKSFSVFYRIHGVREFIMEGSLDDYLKINARIKDKSGIDIAEKRIPGDGRFSIDFNGRVVDVRVSTTPSKKFEIIVCRILDPVEADRRLDEIGINAIEDWKSAVRSKHGLCLICGPTGSGKTTTLNSSIRDLDRFGSAIYTAEDPVEYDIPFVGQVNINSAVGLDFARSLKSFMRADPDIIIIGEIRDLETAKMAVRAAETGHLVIATLHTESIFGTIDRLSNMGVEKYRLKNALRTVLVQTLMRVSCKSCEGKNPKCKVCLGSGYSGRTVISECKYFKTPDAVQDVMDRKPETWVTMIEDGLSRVKSGQSTEEELSRVFGPPADELIQQWKKSMEEEGDAQEAVENSNDSGMILELEDK